MNSLGSGKATTVGDYFNRVARWWADLLGSWQAFIAAVIVTLAWAVSGPLFGFSDTWQLVINTATTVLTFLAVFLIQNAQNRDARALQLKMDELLVKLDEPDARAAGIERAPDGAIEELEAGIRKEAERQARSGTPGGRSSDARDAEVTAVHDTPS